MGKKGDIPAAVFATLLVIAVIAALLRSVITDLTSMLSNVFDAAAGVATTALYCVAAVAALAVIGYFARDIARIRVGGDLEAMRRTQPAPDDPRRITPGGDRQ